MFIQVTTCKSANGDEIFSIYLTVEVLYKEELPEVGTLAYKMFMKQLEIQNYLTELKAMAKAPVSSKALVAFIKEVGTGG